jgi:hypothetical protein
MTTSTSIARREQISRGRPPTTVPLRETVVAMTLLWIIPAAALLLALVLSTH